MVYSLTINQLYARHGQVYKDYVMINRCLPRNEGTFIANTRFSKTLPNDIKEADVYYDSSCKLQSSITPLCQRTIDAIMEGLFSLQHAITLLPMKTIV